MIPCYNFPVLLLILLLLQKLLFLSWQHFLLIPSLFHSFLSAGSTNGHLWFISRSIKALSPLVIELLWLWIRQCWLLWRSWWLLRLMLLTLSLLRSYTLFGKVENFPVALDVKYRFRGLRLRCWNLHRLLLSLNLSLRGYRSLQNWLSSIWRIYYGTITWARASGLVLWFLGHSLWRNLSFLLRGSKPWQRKRGLCQICCCAITTWLLGALLLLECCIPWSHGFDLELLGGLLLLVLELLSVLLRMSQALLSMSNTLLGVLPHLKLHLLYVILVHLYLLSVQNQLISDQLRLRWLLTDYLSGIQFWYIVRFCTTMITVHYVTYLFGWRNLLALNNYTCYVAGRTYDSAHTQILQLSYLSHLLFLNQIVIEVYMAQTLRPFYRHIIHIIDFFTKFSNLPIFIIAALSDNWLLKRSLRLVYLFTTSRILLRLLTLRSWLR